MSRLRAPWRWTTEAAVLVAAFSPAVHAQPPDPPPDAIAGLTGGRLERPRPGGQSAMPLYLDVELNRTKLPQLHRFQWLDGQLHAPPDTLRMLGFRHPASFGNTAVALDSLPGVEVAFDPSRQRVVINAPLDLLDLDTTTLDARNTAAVPAADAAPGTLLNYDLYATDGSHGSGITASSELRVFGMGRGVLSNTAVSRRHHVRGSGWRSESVRLDSRWELSYPERAITATFGDTFTGFLDWTRPVRIGGIQIGRNYALQPYRVTAPLPQFLGEAVVPSDIELYVNGMRQYSGRAPAGPWELTAAPGITGAGHAQVVVTDAFGQVRSLDFPFYSTQRLLARGLSDWSASLGAVRRDYGIRSFSYHGAPVASASWRHGVSNRFTAETHAEGGDGLVNAGLGGVWLLGMAGVLHASHTRSRLDGANGAQTALGYSWSSRRLNMSLDSRRTSGHYRDVASLYGLPPPLRSERATVGFSPPRLGNVSLSYTRLDYSGREVDTARYAGLFWNRSFSGRWSASLSINRNLETSGDRNLHLGIMVPLGHEHQVSSSWQRNGGSDQLVTDLSKRARDDLGHSWRLQARTGDYGSGGLAEATWHTTAMRLGAGISRYQGTRDSWAQASGSLVRMGGGTFASRRIHDAFAVVSTGGVGHIPVKHENRLVGHTDSRGLLLVPRLNAWQRNKLSIDPLDLPADVRVGQVDLVSVPRDRSGTVAEFEVQPARAAVVVLLDADGTALPVGSRVSIDRSSLGSIVGFGGETYIENLDARVRLHITTPTGGCYVTFDYPRDVSGIPRIGPLRCSAESN
ncbi:fimbria/pilus outer membrane usher protein [Luteimonas sp. MJ293]|uniref:fimbria/pilus outer membrane usher protein n=1 Tax=Luteimonas sp. MJ146 TaxID=3129240 RepID=UPI0031BB0CA7